MDWIKVFKLHKENVAFTIGFLLFFYAYNSWTDSGLEFNLLEFIQWAIILYVIFSLGSAMFSLKKNVKKRKNKNRLTS